MVKGNKIQIEQVLLNLLMNSIEALDNTKKTMGKIIIQTHLLPDNTVEITVSDNGPGIDRDITDKIFDAFETNKSTGLGMGLAISRSIIEKHGGKLWTDLQQRNGALFGFNLPVSE
jgi:two-component system sensor kinase FixL